MMWFPKHPVMKPFEMRKIQPGDHEDITWRIICGETLQQVANDYDVTRERIRQIVVLFGIYPKELRYAQTQMKVRKYAEEIIYHMESWHPIHWRSYGISRSAMERHLKLDDYPEYSDLWYRYVLAGNNPYSKNACPDGRVCNRCKVWHPWEDYYADKNGVNGKGLSCKECNKRIVKVYHDARHVPKPTVKHKQCPNCKVVKPASSFWRSTHNNSGLQTYCKRCQRIQQQK